VLRIAAQRVPQALALLLLLSSVCFVLFELSPLDPARSALTAGTAGVSVTEEDIERKREELGLNQSLPVRYVRWLSDLLVLDLGHSYMTTRPVLDLMRERAPNSLLLGSLALLLSLGIGIPLGILVAVKAGTPADDGVRALALLGASLPAFWLAYLAIWLFAVELQWLPAVGRMTPAGLVMPVIVLAILPTARLVRLVRAVALDVLAQDYVRVARAKGLSEFSILYRHVLPNALIPILSLVGLDFGLLVGSAVVVESVFSWPGLGRLGADAAFAGDLPVLLGFVMVAGTVVIVANLIVDLAIAWLDPRERDLAGADVLTR